MRRRFRTPRYLVPVHETVQAAQQGIDDARASECYNAEHLASLLGEAQQSVWDSVLGVRQAQIDAAQKDAAKIEAKYDPAWRKVSQRVQEMQGQLNSPELRLEHSGGYDRVAIRNLVR